jgi:indole-3-glycerol phosphate synthase
MNKLLKEICEKKKEELEILKKKCSINSLKKLLPNKKNRGFKKLIEKSQKFKINNIIAEIKKASPSAGEIINNYVPEDIAVKYEQSGAGAISILTEKFFFKGSIDHLSIINKKTNIPILRKDFIIDPYQIYESKIYGADTILLIVKILNDSQIKEYINIANEIGLDCIIEIHTEEELKRAIKINYPIIGINNRNLDNLSINISNTLGLIGNLPSRFNIIGESGIKNHSDISLYNKYGIFNFLIGETILTSNDIEHKLKELLKNDNTS